MDTQTATPAPRKKLSERSIAVWMSRELVEEIDQFIEGQAHGLLGVKPSRQRFILTAVRKALDEARTAPREAA